MRVGGWMQTSLCTCLAITRPRRMCAPLWPDAARLACAVLREAGSKAAEEKGPGLLADDVPVHIAHTLSEWIGVG